LCAKAVDEFFDDFHILNEEFNAYAWTKDKIVDDQLFSKLRELIPLVIATDDLSRPHQHAYFKKVSKTKMGRQLIHNTKLLLKSLIGPDGPYHVVGFKVVVSGPDNHHPFHQDRIQASDMFHRDRQHPSKTTPRAFRVLVNMNYIGF
jgi:hypothetical protein